MKSIYLNDLLHVIDRNNTEMADAFEKGYQLGKKEADTEVRKESVDNACNYLAKAEFPLREHAFTYMLIADYNIRESLLKIDCLEEQLQSLNIVKNSITGNNTITLKFIDGAIAEINSRLSKEKSDYDLQCQDSNEVLEHLNGIVGDKDAHYSHQLIDSLRRSADAITKTADNLQINLNPYDSYDAENMDQFSDQYEKENIKTEMWLQRAYQYAKKYGKYSHDLLLTLNYYARKVFLNRYAFDNLDSSEISDIEFLEREGYNYYLYPGLYEQCWLDDETIDNGYYLGPRVRKDNTYAPLMTFNPQRIYNKYNPYAIAPFPGNTQPTPVAGSLPSESTWVCPRCGTTVPTTQVICGGCGSKRSDVPPSKSYKNPYASHPATPNDESYYREVEEECFHSLIENDDDFYENYID